MYDNMNDWNYLGQHKVDLENTDILMSPSVIGMASVTFKPFALSSKSLKSFYATLDNKYVGRQYYDNTSSDERAIPAYFVADMAVGYSVPLGRSLGFARDDSATCHFDRPKGVEISSSLTFSFHIHNLFNHRYYADAWLWRSYFHDSDTYYNQVGIYPQAPINFMFKVGWRF